jgi:hypothetical protein
MPTRFTKQNNPYWPLPPDYPELMPEYQLKARRNVLDLAAETPEDLVLAWAFFREYYLRPKSSGWYKRWKPSPPGHYALINDLGGFPRNAWGAPRSFAKSTIANEGAMVLSLALPHFSTLTLRATDKMARKNMEKLKFQFENNGRLVDDFGKLRPVRGDRTWSTERLVLPNGSTLDGNSIGSHRLRGERPDLLLLDDPEWDEEEENSDRKIQLMEDFEVLLFKVLMPMLDEGTSIAWIGTLLTRKSFLYHLLKGDDQRFDYWNKRLYSVIGDDGSLLWEEKWDQKTLAARRAMYGEAAFQSEMMNNPGSGSEKQFLVHPELNTYAVHGVPEKEQSPLQSTVPLHFHEAYRKDDGSMGLQEQVFPFGEFVSRMYRLITVDYAPTISPASDFSCVMVQGFDNQDTQWVLDVFLDKVRQDDLIRKVWELAAKWQCHYIGVEAVSIQKDLANRTRSDLALLSAGTGYVPRVIDIRYPAKMSKSERISGLAWRFNQYRLKLPSHRRQEFGVQQLWHQCSNFTPDLSLLRHDDAVDTLAMHQYVLRRKGSEQPEGPRISDPIKLIEEGHLYDEAGISLLSGINASDLTREAYMKLRDRYADEVEESEENQWNPLSPKPFQTLSLTSSFE